MSSEDDFVKSINDMAASIQGYKESITVFTRFSNRS